MNSSRLRSALFAGATALGIFAPCLTAESVNVPLPEDEMPALAPLVKSALTKSPRTMARDFDLLNAEYGEMISSSRLYPQIGGNIQYQIRYEDQGLGSGYEASDRTYYSLGITQPIWHWGTIRAAAKIGELATQIAQHRLVDARQGLALEVRDSYLGLIVQKMGVRNVRYADGLAQESLARQETRFKASEITQSAINDARLRADESSLALQRAVSDLNFSIGAFRRLTGVDTFSEADIPDAVATPKIEPDAQQVGDQKGYLQSEALMASDLQIDQAKLDNKIDRKLLWPKLSVIAGISQDDRLYSPTRGTITTHSAYAGLQLSWTIFDGFSARGQRLQSLNRIKQLNESRDDMIATLKNSADQQAANVGFSWSSYKNLKVRNRMAGERLATEQDALKRGQSSEEQVKNVRAAYNQAELAANDALAKFYSAAAKYASTMNADPLAGGTSNN